MTEMARPWVPRFRKKFLLPITVRGTVQVQITSGTKYHGLRPLRDNCTHTNMNARQSGVDYLCN